MNDHERPDVALFPLQTVLFPGGRLPLRLFEQRYLGMAKACLRDGDTDIVVATRKDNTLYGETCLTAYQVADGAT